MVDEVIPGLWIGGLKDALNVEELRARNIHSILSAMRGKVTIHATLITHQINIDDSAEEDVLVHFLPSIAFIQKQLDKKRGVLVHCMAGVSRSATIVTAYLMHSLKIDPKTALEMIRKVRPYVDPNEGFMEQLEVFHEASYKFTRRDKAIRMFYMERTVSEVMNGDGSPPPIDMFANYPRTPTDSTPATPVRPSRRIRCKMCRCELATREHMLDHGQLGPPTPAMQSLTPAASRRPSMHDNQVGVMRRPSINISISRRPSMVQPRSRLGSVSNTVEGGPPALSSLCGRGILESLSMSALETEDDLEGDSTEASGAALGSLSRRSSGDDTRTLKPSPLSMGDIGQDLSDALDALPSTHKEEVEEEAQSAPEPMQDTGDMEVVSSVQNQPSRDTADYTTPPAPTTQYSSPADLAAQLYSNPKLAALRSPMGTVPPNSIPGAGRLPVSSPILVNPKCSGYFLEPMKWMEPFLESGGLGGKIICPNQKCGAKLGNYDWAGVCCSCKEWVTPGFCIHRSKVDEIA